MTGIWKFLLFLSITPAIYAQYGGNSSPTSSSAASSTTSSSATTAAPSQSGVRDVNVGQNGRLTFSPDTLAAAVGDKVNFHFFSLNHSVVQSSFNNPCQPIDNGIFSGFMPVNSGEATEMFTVTVNDTNPIWLYCAQTVSSHCQSGMAMVINPPSSGNNTLTTYKSAAAGTQISSAPAQVNGGVLSQNTSPSTTTTTSTSSSSPSPSGSSADALVPTSRNWMAVVVSVVIAGLWASAMA